jgi:hypothetical protein
MNKFENPIQFETAKKAGDLEIIYSDLIEICQGGPVIGTLSINGKLIQSYRFGGPCLYEGKYIYAPAYIKKFFGTSFKLSKINKNTLKPEFLGEIRDLIYLDKILNHRVYFFEDLDKTIYRNYDI